jgi:hypothetical protein
MGHYSGGRNGGELSEHIREAFDDAIEAYVAWDVIDQGRAPEPTVWLRDREISLSLICGLTWNCTDLLSINRMARIQWLAGERLEGITYGSGARRLRKLIAWRLNQATLASS